MTRRAAASEEVQNDGVRVVPGRSEQAIVDSPKALREGKRRSGNQFANKAGSIVVGVIPLVVPNGSIEAKGFPKFDLVAIARLLGAQHRSNSLDRLPRIPPLALPYRLIDCINVRNAVNHFGLLGMDLVGANITKADKIGRANV